MVRHRAPPAKDKRVLLSGSGFGAGPLGAIAEVGTKAYCWGEWWVMVNTRSRQGICYSRVRSCCNGEAKTVRGVLGIT